MVGIVHTLAVWTDDPNSVMSSDLRQFLLQGGAFLPRFAEPARDDNGGLHSLFATILNRLRHHARGNDQHTQIYAVGDLLHIGEAGQPENLPAPGIDGIKCAGKSSLHKVFQDFVAEFSRSFRGPDDRDTGRMEKRP